MFNSLFFWSLRRFSEIFMRDCLLKSTS